MLAFKKIGISLKNNRFEKDNGSSCIVFDYEKDNVALIK